MENTVAIKIIMRFVFMIPSLKLGFVYVKGVLPLDKFYGIGTLFKPEFKLMH